MKENKMKTFFAAQYGKGNILRFGQLPKMAYAKTEGSQPMLSARKEAACYISVFIGLYTWAVKKEMVSSPGK